MRLRRSQALRAVLGEQRVAAPGHAGTRLSWHRIGRLRLWAGLGAGALERTQRYSSSPHLRSACPGAFQPLHACSLPPPKLQPVSLGEARFINLQFHTLSSTPYLAYSDQGVNGGAAVVRRWG